MKDQFTLLNHRKRDHNIQKEDLDGELEAIEEYIRESRIEEMEPMEEDDESPSTCGKFNRPSMLDEDHSSEDENDPNIELASLNTTIKEETPDSDLDDLLSFKTPESRQGIRVRSQQFRLLPENLCERPQGVKRLLPLPLDESERYKKKRFQNGRVQKRTDSRATSKTSLMSHLAAASLTGSFVEKGKFSYKVGEQGLLGIDRVKRGPQAPPSFVQASKSDTGVTVNMNWNGLFEGLSKVAEKLVQPAPAPPVVQQTDGDELSLAAVKLLQMLKAKNYFGNRPVAE